MRLNVERAEEQQYGKGQEDVEQPTVAALPSQTHHHHRYTHMTAGEGCRGALASIMGEFQNVIEESVGVSGDGQRELRVEHIKL